MTQVWTKMLKETKQQLTLYSILDVYAKGQCHWPFGKQHLKLGQISRDFSVSKYLKQYRNQSSVSCSNNNKVTNKELVFFKLSFKSFYDLCRKAPNHPGHDYVLTCYMTKNKQHRHLYSYNWMHYAWDVSNVPLEHESSIVSLSGSFHG